MEHTMIEAIDETLGALMDDRHRLNDMYLNKLSIIQIRYQSLLDERKKYTKMLNTKKGD